MEFLRAAWEARAAMAEELREAQRQAQEREALLNEQQANTALRRTSQLMMQRMKALKVQSAKDATAKAYSRPARLHAQAKKAAAAPAPKAMKAMT